MGREVEIERLVIRLVGDGNSYYDMLKRAEGQTRTFGQNVETIGRSLTTYITAPIAAFAAMSVKAFSEFDKAMTESTSIALNLTKQQDEAMRGLAKSLSFESRQSPTELAKGFYFLISAGMNAAQAMEALPVVEKFATAGAFDLAKATSLAANAQSALGLAVKDPVKNMVNLKRVTDVLVAANAAADGSVKHFSIALTSKAAAALRSVNKDVEEGTAVLAVFANQGIKSELAGNALARVLLLLGKAAIKNSTDQKRLGFDIYDSSGKMKHLADIIEEFEKQLGKVPQDAQNAAAAINELDKSSASASDEMQNAILSQLGFEARIQAALLPLLGQSKNIREFEARFKDAGKGAGESARVAAEQMKAFHNRMLEVWHTIQVVAIEIGEALAPSLLALAGHVRDLMTWWRALDDTTKKNIMTVAGVVASLGPLILTIMAVKNGYVVLASVLSPVFATVAAGTVKLAELGKGLYATLGGVGAATNGFASLVRGLGSALASTAALEVAIIGLATFTLVLLAYKVTGAGKALRMYNDELVRANRLSDQLTQVKQSEQTGKAGKFESITDPSERKAALEKELRQTEKELAGTSALIQRYKKDRDEVTSGWIGWTMEKIPLFGRGWSMEIEMADRNIDEATKRYDTLKEWMNKIKEMIGNFNGASVPSGPGGKTGAAAGGELPARRDPFLNKKIFDTTQKLKEQADTFGMTAEAAKMYELTMAGATAKELAPVFDQVRRLEDLKNLKELQKAADKINEDFGDPREKFTKQVADLDKMLDSNLITFEVYTKAVVAARNQLQKMGQDMEKVQQAGMGTADMFTRIEKWRDLFNNPAFDVNRKPKDGDGLPSSNVMRFLSTEAPSLLTGGRQVLVPGQTPLDPQWAENGIGMSNEEIQQYLEEERRLIEQAAAESGAMAEAANSLWESLKKALGLPDVKSGDLPVGMSPTGGMPGSAEGTDVASITDLLKQLVEYAAEGLRRPGIELTPSDLTVA